MALPALALASTGLSVLGKAVDLISGHDKSKQSAAKDPKLWAQAQDFEQVFTENMTDHLVSGLNGEGPLGNEGEGGEVYRSMLTKEYSRMITQSGGLGIAPQVYNELLKLQEGKPHG
jgi:Rod binding domain-containing protein